MSSNNQSNKSFRPGALVMLLRAKNENPDVQRAVGTVRTLGQPDKWWEKSWQFDPILYASNGRTICWNEKDMKLIPDDPDGEDEMLAITGKPTTVKRKEPQNV